MPEYAYVAISAKGKAQKGRLQATSEDAARNIMVSRKLVLQSLRRVEVSSKRKRTTDGQIVDFFQELNFLLKRGVKVLHAMDILSDSYEFVSRIRMAVASGSSLSDAFRSAGVFDQFTIYVLKTGERSGNLEKVLDVLIDVKLKVKKLKSSLVAVFAYPVLFFVVFVVIFGIFMFVLAPKLQEIIQNIELSRGQVDLLFVTDILFSVSDLMHISIIADIVGFLLFIAITAWLIWSGNMLRILSATVPVVRRTVQYFDLTQSFALLYVLLSSGVTINNTLHVLLEHATARSALIFRPIANGIKEGQTVTAAFMAQKQLEPDVAKLIQIGEEGGDLEEIIKVLADKYNEKLVRNLAIINQVVAIGSLFILGGVVSIFGIFFYLPIFTLAREIEM